MIIGVIVVVIHVIVPSGIIIIRVIVIALGVGGSLVMVVILVTVAVVVVTVEGPRGVRGRAEDGAGLGRLAITGTTETRGQAGTHHAVPAATLLMRRGRHCCLPTVHVRGHVRISGAGWVAAGHGMAGCSAAGTTVPA